MPDIGRARDDAARTVGRTEPTRAPRAQEMGPRAAERAPDVQRALRPDAGREARAAEAGVAERRRAESASAAASELHRAMRGGLFGAGTDEAALHRALQGRSPAEIDGIRRAYRDHYGRDLDADVRGELSGNDLGRAQAALRGDARAADADALHAAMRGAGTDESGIVDTLRNREPHELREIERRYQQRHGESLRSALRGDLGGDELVRAEALLDGNRARADAASLHQAIAGAGTDEGAVYRELAGRSADDRRAIAREYRAQYGRSLRDDINDDFSGTQRDRALGLLDGDAGRAGAAQIREAVRGAGTDEAAVQDALRGRSAEERAAIERTYRARYGADLRGDLDGDLSGHDLDAAQTLLRDGQLSEAQRIHAAILGAGTDEDAIQDVLRGRSRQEIDQIRSDYLRQYRRPLVEDLHGDVSGRDRFDVDMLLRGRPDTTTAAGLQDAVGRAREMQRFEREGWRNAVGRGLVDTFSDSGRTLDRSTARAEEALRGAIRGGDLEPAARDRVLDLLGYARHDVGDFREARDTVAEGATTVAATGTAIGVTALTGGAGAPLSATLLAGTFGGAAAATGTHAAIAGRGTTLEGLGTSALSGGVDGLTVGTGAALAQRTLSGAARGALTREAMREADDVARILAAQGADDATIAAARQGIMRDALSDRALLMAERDLASAMTPAQRARLFGRTGALDGGLGGALGSGTRTALDDRTWRDGLLPGAGRVGGSALTGGTGGALTGGLLGTMTSPLAGRGLGRIDENRVWMDYGNGMRGWGSFEDMMRVNRALQPDAPTLRVRHNGQDVDVRVYGARDDVDLDTVRSSVRRLVDAVGPENAQRAMREVHVRPVIGRTPINTQGDMGEIGGLAHMGRNRGEVILHGGQLERQRATDFVLHHEAGHNLDAYLRRASESPTSPFGRGQTVSDYARLNANEDFAETFRVVVDNWDAIRADPTRYTQNNGDLGPKIQFIIDLIEGRNP